MGPVALLSTKLRPVSVSMCAVKCRRAGSWDRSTGSFTLLYSMSALCWSRGRRSRLASEKATEFLKCKYFTHISRPRHKTQQPSSSHKIFSVLFFFYWHINTFSADNLYIYSPVWHLDLPEVAEMHLAAAILIYIMLWWFMLANLFDFDGTSEVWNYCFYGSPGQRIINFWMK